LTPPITCWARIDRVYFGTRLEDTTKIGFDDEFQYEDFQLPREQRKAIKCFPDFEREFALKACEAWQNKKDRPPYWDLVDDESLAW
jgi:guanine deaminase